MNGTEFFAKVIHEPSFSKMHPKVASFLKGYLSHEKVAKFDGRYVVNTHFPPYPSRAFDTMAAQFNAIGSSTERSLFSVTLAVTNRCSYNCWHCYNAGRSLNDTPLSVLKDTARQLQELHVVHVTLTGGEPLLRPDLEEVARAFDDSTYLGLNTTGAGLTLERARALKKSGLFALGVSLDSTDSAEHDRMRGKEGAFDTALAALDMAGKAGLYPYVIAVGTHELLQPDLFEAFMQFAGECGAREVHLLEPSATGKLAGRKDILLTPQERLRVLDFQRTFAEREDLPILSSFMYVESPEAFGCGAGLTHLYIDGSGEVCPCNLVPLSFGNVKREPLIQILDRMGTCFGKPRTCCVGQDLAEHIGDGALPLGPEASAAVCQKHLPSEHPVPRFFRVRGEAQGNVGSEELKAAYNRVHGHYDTFWVCEAGKPVRELVEKAQFRNRQRVFEAGCGTGYATVRIAGKLGASGEVYAVDLSEGMLAEARVRAREEGSNNVRFVAGDALKQLESAHDFDTVFTSWVLGYIPLAPFFARAHQALVPGGHVAFVVHKENSPREPMELFQEIVAEDPSVLEKRVAFDFPRDMDHVREVLRTAGFEVEQLWNGAITFHYDSAEMVLEHLLKSGAGTAFYDAVDPKRRKALEQRFVHTLAARHAGEGAFSVVHDYISCIAKKV
ncbi:MAG: radical SAM protein [Candidatus Hydrogenedentales bacterium]|jgi:MoaA/NifB/PqqE/SkfB family radical SAM enzyme/SAM-dependent methyltransferase